MIMKESIKQAKKEIKALQESIKLVQAKREEISKEISVKRQELTDIKAERMKFFLGSAVDQLQCESDGGYFQFNKLGKRLGLSGSFTIRSEFRYGGDIVKELSYYTTTCDSDDEFKRLEIIGKVASKLRSVTAEELYDFLNEGLEARKKELSELRDNRRIVMDRTIRDMEDEIRQHEDDIVFLQLQDQEGVKVDDERDAASLSVGNEKIYASQATSVKIKEVSASGKTATVEVVSLHTFYDTETKGYVSKPFESTYTRVKMNQLLYGVKNFLDRVEKFKQQRLIEEQELADTAS